MIHLLQAFAWEVLCAVVFYSAFCRCTAVDDNTKPRVKNSFFLLGLSSLIGIGAPFYGWQPDWVDLAIVFGVAQLQVTMSLHWKHGVPEPFKISQFQGAERRGFDRRKTA